MAAFFSAAPFSAVRRSYGLSDVGLVVVKLSPCGCHVSALEQEYWPEFRVIECRKCGATFGELDAHDWAYSFVDQ